MNRTGFLIAVVGALLVQSQMLAQSSDVPKYEVAAEFTTLERDSFEGRTEPGIGVRFTYNLNKVFSLEAAAYHFPRTCFSCAQNGTATEAVGGLKVGKRFEKWGIFAKARPGIVSFSRGEFNVLPALTPSVFPFEFVQNRQTNFAVDAGGVVEFYPSRKIVTRFDFGDTIIHFNSRTFNAVVSDPTNTTFTTFPIRVPGRATHNFQFVTSVGFRF